MSARFCARGREHLVAELPVAVVFKESRLAHLRSDRGHIGTIASNPRAAATVRFMVIIKISALTHSFLLEPAKRGGHQENVKERHCGDDHQHG